MPTEIEMETAFELADNEPMTWDDARRKAGWYDDPLEGTLWESMMESRRAE